MTYEAIIGLEIHLRLNTETKMFCRCANTEEAEPNSVICPICTGQPGVLPVLNAEGVRLATKLSLALNLHVRNWMKFDRKNYFYPDLPRGYQISQFDYPLGHDGYIDILTDDVNVKRIAIERLHIEEDSGKLKHDAQGRTLVDFNRSGQPLAELVTKPDMRTPQEAKAFAMELQQIARYIGASQADMEKGHMRCDVNISLRPVGDTALYPKTEIKNINSFRSIERAIAYEIERQTQLWNEHQAPEKTTTRGWDDAKGVTVLQRTKEDAADYRYFPEPDVPPLTLSDEYIANVRRSIPELPTPKRMRFVSEFGLSFSDAKVLCADTAVAEFFEDTISELRSWLSQLDSTEGSREEMLATYSSTLSRLTCNWISSELFKLCNKTNTAFVDIKITAENFAELLALVYEKKVNSSAAQQILQIMFETGGDPSDIMREHNLEQSSDSDELERYISGVLNENAQSVADYKAGKQAALMFLVGKVMKASKGKANPQVVTEILKKKLD
ncbi:MAG: Asp-tRNA(Asn)/Glu-tRNA(Gln) amidotransferase subunit GatB [Candidatus Kerfeldbacteria bacterium]|nr:Asp-tRNA(Asn)/Glu-tRNA(Gln) amidotransferase subunit GatB [Candidatus Kerfeldbacteria bacterium]